MIPYTGEVCNSLDPWVNHAIQEAKFTYGNNIVLKPKSILKFGRIDSLGTSEETIWQRAGHETYVATNAIDKISSDDATDTQQVKVEGHTVDGDGNFEFVVQTVTLAGQTETALSVPLARASRMYNIGSTDFAGTVYVYEDDTVVAGVPQTTAKIHLQSTGANNQSQKAATTVSSADAWLITSLFGAVNKKTSAQVDITLQIREKGSVFRNKAQTGVSTTGGSSSMMLFQPYIIVPPNADVRIIAAASTTSVAVDAWVNGPLCRVVE